MTQTNFLESAKMGDPRVIAGLLNRSLQTQGIATKATRRNNELHLLLEGENLQTKQDSIVDYLVQALSRLQVPATTVNIYAKVPGQEEVIWRHSLSYPGPEVTGLPTMPSNFTLPTPESAEPEMTPNALDEDNFSTVESSFDTFAQDDDRLGSMGDDFLETAPSMDTFNQEEKEKTDTVDSFDLSPLPPSGYLDPEEENGHGWNGSGADEIPLDEEDSMAENTLPKSSFPVLPLSLAAIVALLFAGAGFYYRLVLFPASTEPPVPTQVTTNLPPESVPSLPATLPGDTTGQVPLENPVSPAQPTTPPVDVVVSAPPDAPVPDAPAANPWRDAINAAMEAAEKAQVAQTAEDWGVVAETWDKSIQLLLAVPETDPNYGLAQTKVVEYTANLDIARNREETSGQ
jgi:hypothetical protein